MFESRGAALVSSDMPDGGFVVATDTSTGVGAATALHVAGNGFHVFAAADGAGELPSSV
jgi:hypothetical protein